MLLIDYGDGFAVMSAGNDRDARGFSLDLISYMSANGIDFRIGGKSEDVVMTINPRDAETCHELRSWWKSRVPGRGTTVSLAARALVASDRFEGLRQAIAPLLPANCDYRLDEQVELMAALRLIEADGASSYRLTELGAECLMRLGGDRQASPGSERRVHRIAPARSGRD